MAVECDYTIDYTGHMDRQPAEIIGVYHADGGPIGELRYVIGKARGTTHCALCDITHGLVRRKSEWNRSCSDFDLPIRLVHLNERTAQEARACTLGTPTVLVRWTDGEVRPLLGPADLELEGSVTRFFDRLTAALNEA